MKTATAKKLAGLLILTAFMLFAMAQVCSAVNIKLTNVINKINRGLDAKFIKGFILLGDNKIVEEGQGYMGGDCSIRKVYYGKTRKEYEKTIKNKSVYSTNADFIQITVDLYETDKIAREYLKKAGMQRAKRSVGYQTWTKVIEKDPRDGKVEGNYNGMQVSVINKNLQVNVLIYNYVKEYAEEDLEFPLDIAQKIISMTN